MVWRLKSCPRCGGDVFYQKEGGGWYMECLQCSYSGNTYSLECPRGRPQEKLSRVGCCVTSWPSVKVDLKNEGANWVDEPVVQDGNLITSCKPADLPEFDRAIIKALEG